MDISRLMDRTVIIHRTTFTPWDVDELGRPLRIDDGTTVTRCRLRLQDAPEYVGDRDGLVVSEWKCYLPRGTEVRDSDRFTIDGVEYRPVAAVEQLGSPLTAVGYVSVILRRVDDAT